MATVSYMEREMEEGKWKSVQRRERRVISAIERYTVQTSVERACENAEAWVLDQGWDEEDTARWVVNGNDAGYRFTLGNGPDIDPVHLSSLNNWELISDYAIRGIRSAMNMRSDLLGDDGWDRIPLEDTEPVVF